MKPVALCEHIMGSQDAADLLLGQHLTLLKHPRLHSCEQLLLKVERNVAQFSLMPQTIACSVVAVKGYTWSGS
jgi:hypothetical protein